MKRFLAIAAVQFWSRQEVVALQKDGMTGRASASGPMAEVVFSRTQHLTEQDLEAMAAVMATGDGLYRQHCASCHGEQGLGAPGICPALAGNRAVTLAAHHNLVQLIRHGGFIPATAGNPRPFGMPPFGQVLNRDEIAALVTFIRQSWGNDASPVTALDVLHVN
jgi:mono/diheme cytochrome c family protein